MCVCGGGGGGGGEVSNRNPASFKSKLYFHGKFWINLINLGYRIYPKYSHPLLFTSYFSSTCIKLLDEWQTV